MKGAGCIYKNPLLTGSDLESLSGEVSHEKSPGWLGYIGDYTTSYIGIIINHYKDPY